jgi:DNA-binding SARP family transcriptional activator
VLDRKVVEEFLKEKLESIEIPKDISFEELIKAFSLYVENDYYEWLKDNFKSFFNYGNPDWDWIRKRIEHHSRK